MAAEEEAAAGGKVLREENQRIAPVVSSRVSPRTGPTAMGSFSSHMTEFPRKRKASDSDPSQSGIMTEKVVEKISENPLTYLLSTRIEISASSGSRVEDGEHQVKMKAFRSWLRESTPSSAVHPGVRRLYPSLLSMLMGNTVRKKREAHSQTEKRRRDKMNNLIEELSAMIPQCNPMARKLDKLTVLRMAVQHLRSLKEHRKFYTIHCTGYLRSWPPNIVGMEEERNSKKDNSNFTCLVAIGRLQPYIIPQNSGEIHVKPTEFITRFAMNGKFVYVDQRATAILGYLPQELLGTSCYEYFHQDDHSNLTDKHKAVLQSKEKILTDSYKFRAKDGSFVTLKSQWFSFTNPWTKELEYIVSVNTLVLGHSEPGEASFFPCSSQSSEESSRQSCMSVPGMSAGTVLGAGSIGTDIANEILDLQRLQSSSYLDDLSPTNLMKDTNTVNCRSMSNKELFPPSPSEMGELEATRQNQSTVAVHSHEPLLSDGAQLDFDTLCDNDDTAMAAFMNYLEAEGGLGDPGDFSDIQWTL
uniref:aryl hydrocarbon receptor nuclear translocator-like protein 2 isoform X6 n=1 Tax=Macaca mulatta TaxID=9544 RepID=UPI0010A22F05|nr:aryl hydrocarbon receptor nuclear translocator-like protein 2 isoform X6 [Macaca mulatta]